MNCRKYRNMLIRGTENIPAQQRERLCRHLRICETCRMRAERLESLAGKIRDSRHVAIPMHACMDLWESIRPGLKDVKSIGPVRPPLYKYRIRLALGIPSLAVLTLLVWFSVNRLTSNRRDLRPVPAAESNVAIESATLNGKEAIISIFEINNPSMTFIWLDN